MGAAAYKIFDVRGGSIGRLDTNDWALPDPDRFVSSRHAVVRFAGGAFCLEDVSTNGTFLNAPHLAVGKEVPARLKDGDRVYIGDYEILVQLIDDGAPAGEQRPLESLGTADRLAVIGAGARADGAGSPASAGSPGSAGSAISAPPPVPTASFVPAAPVGLAGAAHELFAALGLDARDVDPALASALPGLLRAAVQGIIDVRRARAKPGSARLEDGGGDAAASLRLMFGEQFVKACHEQLEKLAQSANSHEK
jgi:predicted component of type VI protein secretion system